ncbi:esterase [uncultured Sphingomonas sp.]|uniref:alpha/beta hydrolase-fold protein n=1 Tax=uncultured Sphingomonas sp. TaxID=158754 RepID=UPI0025F1D1E6|nr:esterase [uncultured Sphingomonas sp.]
MHLTRFALAAGLTIGSAGTALPAAAQQQPPAVENCLQKDWFAPPPTYKSVEVLADGRVTFRICAPNAKEAKVVTSDIPGFPAGLKNGFSEGLPMQRDATGLWSVTSTAPIAPDTYRFNFQVDGAPVPDPRGATWSEQVNGITTTFEVPGAAGAFQAYDRAVPHGAVSTIEYWSDSIGAKRRAHVYTPPGYMTSSRRYPVVYLVHGAGDSDDSWTSVGHANYILDNLIATGKALPMIVVMPAGHTPATVTANLLKNDAFGADLTKDLIPFVDRTYRTQPTAASRAMAGLSMGGAHTLQFGLPRSDLFRYIGIFSMGLGVRDPSEVTAYETANATALKQAAQRMRLVYYAIGKDDFLYASAAPTRAMMDKYGIRYGYHESEGGHTWINWRRYWRDLAPLLFR